MANYSPPSSGNHRSLFVKPAKRGKQRAGGGALFALHHFTFNYQPRHTHNCFISQLGTSCSFDSPGLASESEVYPGLFAISENNAVGVVPMIAQGWCQPTLGYACCVEVNAVGVVRFLRGMPR